MTHNQIRRCVDGLIQSSQFILHNVIRQDGSPNTLLTQEYSNEWIIEKAVSHYWMTRHAQREKQKKRGINDSGLRNAVTGEWDLIVVKAGVAWRNGGNCYSRDS